MWLLDKIDDLIDKVKDYFNKDKECDISVEIVSSSEYYRRSLSKRAFEIVGDSMSSDDYDRISSSLTWRDRPGLMNSAESFARYVLEEKNKELLREKSKEAEKSRDIDLINELKVKIGSGGD
jgi:hypothetical protein